MYVAHMPSQEELNTDKLKDHKELPKYIVALIPFRIYMDNHQKLNSDPRIYNFYAIHNSIKKEDDISIGFDIFKKDFENDIPVCVQPYEHLLPFGRGKLIIDDEEEYYSNKDSSILDSIKLEFFVRKNIEFGHYADISGTNDLITLLCGNVIKDLYLAIYLAKLEPTKEQSMCDFIASNIVIRNICFGHDYYVLQARNEKVEW